MSNYNFDNIINRHGTHSVKTDVLKELYGRDDLIALWVADMDFKADTHIIESIKEVVEHGIYGYPIEPPQYKDSIVNWLQNIQQWKVEKEWLAYLPGIVRGMSYAIQHFTNENDKIIIQQPVYHPFRLIPQNNNRQVANNPLTIKKTINNGDWASNIYAMDFENLRQITEQNNCKMLILCHPHNPGGIVWDKAALVELAEICYEKQILVISDEIHADLQLWNNQHIPFATVSEKAAQISITMGAPSKSFNIPGLCSSYVIISNPEIRIRFYKWLSDNGYSSPTLMASAATIAAYTKSNPWRKAMLKYIEENIQFTEEYCRQYISKINVIKPQASYLIWLDCRQLNLKQPDLVNLFVNKAHLALNDGAIFGSGGEGFMRMNVGCPKQIVEQALNNLRKVLF